MRSPRNSFPIALSILLSLLPAATARALLPPGDSCSVFETGLFFDERGVDVGVSVLATFDDGSVPALYAGGPFTRAGSVPANGIARWDGTSWSALGSGVASPLALVGFDDGSGPALYVGGAFSSAGGVPAANIARWNGTAWSAVGGGVDGAVRALAVFDDGTGPALYAAGNFHSAGGVAAEMIARWDGAAWSKVGSGLDRRVFALAAFDDGSGAALYAGGEFVFAGGLPARRIARWDGVAWSAVGGSIGTTGGEWVGALEVFDDGGGAALYAGGRFASAGGVATSHLARWDGASWSSPAGGVGGTSSVSVDALRSSVRAGNPALFVGGNFDTAGGVAARGIASWDGIAFSAVGSGALGVACLAEFDEGEGVRTFAGGSLVGLVGGIARWDGASWSEVGRLSGPDGPVHASIVWDDGAGPALVIGGQFSRIGDVAAAHVAKWDGHAWSALGAGIDGYVYALAVFDDGSGAVLCAGGRFETAGSAAAHNVARWDGGQWSALGSFFPFGSGNGVYALQAFDDGSGPALYAGGEFSAGSGNHIARFKDGVWSGLGVGATPAGSAVEALAAFDDGSGAALYAGGSFNSMDLLPARGLARLDASGWSVPGGGLASTSDLVTALAVADLGAGPSLVAAGSFSSIGGVATRNVASWNGVAWAPVGSGLGPRAAALATHEDSDGRWLVAAADAVAGDGTPIHAVARFDGACWSALGDGLPEADEDSIVLSLARFDSGSGPALYVGPGWLIGRPRAFLEKWTDVCAPVLAGNVDSMLGPPANVLFVNGSKGSGPGRRIDVDRDALFQIRMKLPGSDADGAAPFMLHAWVDRPSAATITQLPLGYGTMGMPPELTGGNPKRTWNNTGDATLGAADLPSQPAPSVVLRRPSGVRRTITFFLQGLVEDAASPSGVYAVTNGIRVDSR